jgi:hypothetical protein
MSRIVIVILIYYRHKPIDLKLGEMLHNVNFFHGRLWEILQPRVCLNEDAITVLRLYGRQYFDS